MIKELPAVAKNIIESYRNLDIDGTKVRTPYFRNIKRIRGGLRVLTGKGSAQELQNETRIFAKLRGYDLKGKSPEETREFMQLQGLGIDCSGFVIHVYNEWTKMKLNQRLPHYLSRKPIKGLGQKVLYSFKYAQLTSALMLTSEHNTNKVELKDIQPGDLLRLRGAKQGDHILLISKVEYDEYNTPITFTYTHAAEHYGESSGVKEGNVVITDIELELKDQDWQEADESGRNWTYEGLLNEYEDNGIRRFKFADKLK
jgi:hypothetical protein